MGRKSNLKTAVRLSALGQRMILAAIICMIIGRIVVKKRFPELAGSGLSAGALAVLVPVWTIAIAGAILSLVAWIHEPALMSRPEAELAKYGIRPQWKRFKISIFTRVLASGVLMLLLLGMFALALDERAGSFWRRTLAAYSFGCLLVFLIYLCLFYAPTRHHATKTYLHLLHVFAFLLIPLTWPILIALNVKTSKPKSRAAAGEATPRRRRRVTGPESP